MTVQIEQQNAIKAYRNGTKEIKEALLHLFGKEVLEANIMDRVKTYEDACAIKGIDPKANLPYDESKPLTPDQKSMNAYAKLIVIISVINEDWVPDWSDDDEWKYVPYFKYTSGVGFSSYDYAYWFTHSHVGSRLCYQTSEKAIYVAKQFIAIYNDYLTINS